MEFKLKLCFQNDLIRFIGDKLDKVSKLILVCMRYFILIEISYFIRGDTFPLLKNRQFVFPPITYCFRSKSQFDHQTFKAASE